MVSTFLDDFLEFTKDAESPTSYFQWAAYTVLAAVLRDNVYLDLGLKKVYPNIYTLILSTRSSVTRKSVPLKSVKRLIQKVHNTKLIMGRTSVQALLQTLGDDDLNDKKQKLKGGSAFLYSEELSAFLVDDPRAIDLLTECYDFHENWDKNLVSLGRTRIHNVCVSMLTSSNEELVRQIFDSKATHGGLLARTFLIIESEKRQVNSLMYSEYNEQTDKRLVAHLEKCATLRGVFTMTDGARKVYDEWYKVFSTTVGKESTTGIEARIHDHILKLSMVLSVNQQFDKVITEKMIRESIKICLGLMKNYEMFQTTSAESDIAKPGRELLIKLKTARGYTLTEEHILWEMWGYGRPILDKVFDTLKAAQYIEVAQRDGKIEYKLTPKFLNKFKDQEVVQP